MTLPAIGLWSLVFVVSRLALMDVFLLAAVAAGAVSEVPGLWSLEAVLSRFVSSACIVCPLMCLCLVSDCDRASFWPALC